MTAPATTFFTQQDIDRFHVEMYLLRHGEPVDPASFERLIELDWVRPTDRGYELTPRGARRLS